MVMRESPSFGLACLPSDQDRMCRRHSATCASETGTESAVLPLIAEHRSEIAALCRRFGVRRLEVFGSAGRNGDFDPQRSDVDFVVAFERDDGASLAEFFALRNALSAALGRPVDLIAEESVRNPFIRAGIQRSAETVYGS
jgi:predicted nucleotidyltransferase